MDDGRAHPLLAQIPLTVSPFISLPKATTLPYTYKSLPSTLPPSSTGEGGEDAKPKYVISQSGHAAHPDDIIASCHALQAHLKKMQDDAENTLKKWQDDIKDRELAEKRRVAPGWLDREEKILEPERRQPGQAQGGLAQENIMDMQEGSGPPERSLTQEGEELDRAFGGMQMRNS
ncbi:MAG: hypothetical protein LQ340_004740 [Diploschistes diacapsis]|nr:MAG: hypothetical protein LQ340_004740 [Diploschistes diacapsis]